jgi:hypothetical protein
MALCPVTGSHFTECAGNHDSDNCLRNSIPHPPTWPGYIDNRQCDCGGYHSPADCPNTIVEWNGWQA